MSTPDPLQSAFRSAAGAVLAFLNVSRESPSAPALSRASGRLAELLIELQAIEHQLTPFAKSDPERHKPLESRRAVLRHQAGRVDLEIKKAPSGKDLAVVESVLGRLGEEIDKLRMAVEALQAGSYQPDEEPYEVYLEVDTENPNAYILSPDDSVDSSAPTVGDPDRGREPVPPDSALRDGSALDVYSFVPPLESEPVREQNQDSFDELVAASDDASAPEDERPGLTASQVEDKRKLLNRALAHLASFLPAGLWQDWSGRLDASIKPYDPLNGEQIQAAYEALQTFEAELAGAGSELSLQEAKALRERIGRNLPALPDSVRQPLDERLADLRDDGADIRALRALDGDVRRAVDAWKKAVAGLTVDFQSLGPLVEQAVKLAGATAKNELKAELEGAWTRLEAEFDGSEGHGGLGALRDGIDLLRALAKKTLDQGSAEELLALQSANLPVDLAALSVGDELGHGQFGAVSQLSGSDDTPLVGKAFRPGNTDAKKEMEHEAQLYAKLGDHPNIGKCYGIHEIEGQPMLVMEQIQGKDMNDLFSELEDGYRDEKLNRQQYLGTVQQMIKGILQGLAHFESVGLVHRDIKGDNIRFDEKTGQPKLIDLGLSQELGPQQEGKHFFPTSPPEVFVTKAGDPVVQNVWDSFSTGKILFPLLEQDPDSAEHFQFVTGVGAMEAELTDRTQGSIQPTIDPNFVETVKQGVRDSVQVDGQGVVSAKTDGSGQLVGQTLKPKGPEDKAKPGEFGAMTAYVDFMNRLTHPDPAQRLSPLAALKHPFMIDALLDEEEAARLMVSLSAEVPASQAVVPDIDDFDLDDDVQGAPPPDFETWKNFGINTSEEVATKLGLTLQALEEMESRLDSLFPDILARELGVTEEQLFITLTSKAGSKSSGVVSDDEEDDSPPDFEIWKNLGINPSEKAAGKLGLSLQQMEEMESRLDVLYPDVLAGELKITQEELFKLLTSPATKGSLAEDSEDLDPEAGSPSFDSWKDTGINPSEEVARRLGLSLQEMEAMEKRLDVLYPDLLAAELGISEKELYERIHGAT
jgi:serine/threonine protein kinase